ncbi:ROK family protein [Clostridium botulinum]|uniref:ROK family protein n=1 Tax=Clostridium botulinum TaxID=1491 RepID=UPI001C9BB9D0|nr:ROK family protein [Clostridium botulinum]MBY6789317.1 ROK family protein [Clostridium botulinum]NFG76192.1 ROK family protein [Clostridium botulinum]
MKYYIGIDIGGTNLRAAILDEECNLVDKLKISNEVEEGPEYNLDKLILEIKERWSDKEIISVGVGCPGQLDIRSGTILVTPNLRTWEYFKLKEYLENKFDLPVFVNNDANVAGYSEAMVGAGKGAEKGNMELQKMLSEWVINVSKAIANIIVTVDPEVIVLGGSVIINNPSYLNKIKEETQKRVFDGIKINIKLAEIGDDTGLIGAGLLGKLK